MNSTRAAIASAMLTFVATLSTFVPDSSRMIVGAFLSIPAFVLALIGLRSRRHKLALLRLWVSVLVMLCLPTIIHVLYLLP